MDPAKQMRIGALLALATLVIPILAAIAAGVLGALGYSDEALAPVFLFLVPVMFVVFVTGVVFAVVGFIRRGRAGGS